MRRSFIAILGLLLIFSNVALADDPLPSWNDTAPKKTITTFVGQVTRKGSPDFVPVNERIAVFDNDGTLWAEQPMYFHLIFALDRVKALAPRHLKNSIETNMKYEKGDPQIVALLQGFTKVVLAPKPKPPAGQPESLAFYKSNMNAIVGDGETVPWPAYTSYLDIEPELAVVYGSEKQPVAGFCIFNDVSARDVQATEFIGGFCLTKDMAKGNQLGPYLVTPDEVGDPYNLKVTVLVNGQLKYQGSTSDISHKAGDVFAWLRFMAPIKPGSVMGFGTIPDCTGLDHDDFIDPNAEIQITFERLGTLRCRFAEPTGKLLPSRWPVREPLKKYHG
jgi:2-keto-4-pentenoate hydratase/2-oxohepta-3-ene-1,7-dioic acid hydratase in catechol pathway